MTELTISFDTSDLPQFDPSTAEGKQNLTEVCRRMLHSVIDDKTNVLHRMRGFSTEEIEEVRKSYQDEETLIRRFLAGTQSAIYGNSK